MLYAYEAQNDDELTIKEGDVITVLTKEVEDKGWWKGELNGRVGVFPDNFVKLIKEEVRAERANTRLCPHSMWSCLPSAIVTGRALGGRRRGLQADKESHRDESPVNTVRTQCYVERESGLCTACRTAQGREGTLRGREPARQQPRGACE